MALTVLPRIQLPSASCTVMGVPLGVSTVALPWVATPNHGGFKSTMCWPQLLTCTPGARTMSAFSSALVWISGTRNAVLRTAVANWAREAPVSWKPPY